MAPFRGFVAVVSQKVAELKEKLLNRDKKEDEKKKIVIGAPTNFRRENITLGTRCEGEEALAAQAREDARAMHTAMKNNNAALAVEHPSEGSRKSENWTTLREDGS